ncbi:MAG: ABC transporter ATP-binding protein [Peptostreptococcaceae bacterium]|nr:ABC transporter ATP-binding protein [Peptostreptococcaceae bacterium]
MSKLKNVIRFYTIIIGIVSVIVVLCNSGIPLVVKGVTDSLVEFHFDKVNQQLVFFILLILLVLFCEFANKVLNSKFKVELILLFRKLYVKGVLRSEDHIEDPQELYSVYNNEIQTLIEDYYLLIPSVFFQISSVLWYTIILFYLNKWVAFLIVLTNIITILIPYAFEKDLQYLKDRNLIGLRKLNLIFHDIVEGLTTINDYMIHRKIFDKIEEKSLEQQKITYRYNLKVSFLQILIGVVQFASQFLVVFLLARSIMRGESTVGTFLAVFQLSDLLVGPIISLSSELISISATKKVKQDLFDWMSDESFKKHHPKAISNISLENVSFSYNNENLLEKISCCFEFPKKYLIIGANGSGKSTFLKLIFGDLKNYDGSIKIDGVDIRECPDLSKNISYIRQNSYLFNENIMNNITLFQEIDKKEVDDIIQKVQLDPNLIECRDETLNELDLKISGGEKQKIIIARALLQKKSFVIFDEAMSSIDVSSAEKIERFMLEDPDIAFIHIAHNYSGKNISKYDAIFEVGKDGIRMEYQ